MSFLSRRPSRPGSRDGDAGHDDEYGDYDYAPAGYGGDEDESWSPGEYFSPEGIKGRWAGGERAGDRSDARGRRGDSGQGYEDRADGGGYDDSRNGYGPGGGHPGGYGYGTDEYATGAYDLPEDVDEEPAERGGRRRKDRGEWTGRLRLRRDRGEDIWPDDGISDEDYWASVASDRPLTGANPPLEADPLTAADSRPTGRPSSQVSNDGGVRLPAIGGDDVRTAAGPRLGDARTGSEQRFGAEQRGVTGRLGPPPGLRGDYQQGGGGNSDSGPIGGGRSTPGTGTGRAASGPMTARQGTGPMAARPGAGSAGAWSSQAGYAQSGTGQPSYQPVGPAGSRPQDNRPQDNRETDSRQTDRAADWGERTERIDRVNASGYPEPRGSSRSQGADRPGPSRASGPFGLAVPVGRGSTADRGTADRGSADRGSADRSRPDGADRWAPDRWAPGRDPDRENVRNSGGWPVAGREGAPADRAGDDDPLTSRAYSRAAVSDADGRSYRVAARRSQAQTKLTEQTATFTAAANYPSNRAGQYEPGAAEAYPTGQYPTGATGEYPAAQHQTGATSTPRAGQYQTGEYGHYQADAQAPPARYPGYGSQSSQSSQPIRRQSGPVGPNGQASGPAGSASPGRPASPSGPHNPNGFGRPGGSGGPNGAGAPGRPSGPNGAAGQPGQAAGQPVGNSGRVTLPSGSATHSGQYPTQPAQQSRQPHQRPQSQPSRQAAPSLPPVGGSGSPAGSGPARTAAAATGQNPYESTVTGAYPYPSQPYPPRPSTASTRPPAASPALDGRDSGDSGDDRYYRPGPPPADGYGPANAEYGTPGYGTSRDGRY